MYDMYPEWGPARSWPADPQPPLPAVQLGLDVKDHGGQSLDNGGQRPDDS